MLGDNLGKIVAIILAVMLLFIVPTLYSFERVDDVTYTYLYNETNIFVDAVRDLGYITPATYQEYMEKINTTGNIYKVTMEHKKKLYVPDTTNPEGYIVVFESSYNYDILESVLFNTSLPENERIYKLQAGDYFIVEVYNTNSTKADVLKGQFSANEKNIMYIRLGGMCRNGFN